MDANKQSWMQHPRSKQIAIISLIVILIGVIIWFFFFRPYVFSEDARVSANISEVGPENIGGQVTKLDVDAGDWVTQGEIMLELDHQMFQAQLEKSKAAETLARLNYIRDEKLVESQGVPVRVFDVAKAQYIIAKSNEKMAQLNLNYSYVRSPVTGYVVKRFTDLGNILAPGQVAFEVADMAHAWISADIEETSIGAVKTGDRVYITVDSGGDLTGKVSEITAATEAEFSLLPAEDPSGNFIKLVQRIPIKIKLNPHPKVRLFAGQSVEVRIQVY
jgi:multidrug resistance efflux pump